VPTLVDAAAVDAAVIRREAEQVEGVRSAYGIRSRTASAMRFAELTIAVDSLQNVAEAHRIADAVEARLSHELSIDHVQVHVEPC
jgi:divalent metal cation (Fe/Co/Zn/Cd) transporter